MTEDDITGGPVGLPIVATTVEELDDQREKARIAGDSVAVVMTMGALHAGHVALIRMAHAHADRVYVTIFVNPLQFGPAEDLDTYPRTLAADIDLCAHEGVDVVFAPPVEEIYPGGEPRVRVTAGELGNRLCGRSRPGHFDGVLTVVAKLLHLAAPDVAVFGEKDAQQLALIRRMVEDLDFGVEIVGVPTVREPGGLALSSRNAYLSPEERAAALALNRSLRAAEAAYARGADPTSAAAEVLAGEPRLRLDYLELVDPGTLDPSDGGGLLAVAAYAGRTRLIDNITLTDHTTLRPEP